MRKPKEWDLPKRIEAGRELASCPDCGYDAGFHVGFRRRERMLQVVLICPSCRARFETGEWAIPSGEPRPFDPEIDAGP